MKVDPLISVCMITYGHEKYIAKAIHGVLDQKTTIPFELVIANDCSPDNTDDLIKDLISSHPKKHLVRYYKQDRNLGMLPNFAFALHACNGKYIALCEGDDYWFDDNKLQIQYDFLENNQDFSLVGHNAKFNKEDQEMDELVRKVSEEYLDFTTPDLIQKNPFVSSMVMFRNIGFQDIMLLLDNFTVGDWPVFTKLSLTGKSRFINIPVGYYRKHSNSVTSKNRVEYSAFKKDLINRIKHATYWNAIAGNKQDKIVHQVKEMRSRQLTKMAFRNKDIKTSIFYSQFINLNSNDKLKFRCTVRLFKWINKLY